MAVTRTQKEEILKELIELFQKAKCILITDHRGLKVQESEKLRKSLREKGLTFKVAKKTLMDMAAQENGLPVVIRNNFDGAVSLTFSSDDEIVACRVLHTFSKEHENLKICGGFLNGQLLPREEIQKLALLPSREQLLGMCVFTMKAPLNQFHGILHGVLQKFVIAVKAIEQKNS